MSERSMEHAIFVVERMYDASPDRTFAAWSDPQAKARWYNGSEGDYELDFRVGGWERHGGIAPDGREYASRALFWDIVPGQRIVYTYDMLVERIRISVSVATAEFKPERDGTRLVFTEQGAFVMDHEIAARREHGISSLPDLVGRWLQMSQSDGGRAANRTAAPRRATAFWRRHARTGRDPIGALTARVCAWRAARVITSSPSGSSVRGLSIV